MRRWPGTVGRQHAFPVSTLRDNDVVITSKWSHFDVITSKWRRFDIITTLLLRHVFRGVVTRHCDGHITWVIASQTPIPRLFVELLVRANSKENTKAPHYRPCAFVSGFHRCGFPSQRVWDMESISISHSWRQHDMHRPESTLNFPQRKLFKTTLIYVVAWSRKGDKPYYRTNVW